VHASNGGAPGASDHVLQCTWVPAAAAAEVSNTSVSTCTPQDTWHSIAVPGQKF
jgi:hypothetical protein